MGNYSFHGFISIQYIYTTIESMVAASVIRVSQNLHAPVAHIKPVLLLLNLPLILSTIPD